MSHRFRPGLRAALAAAILTAAAPAAAQTILVVSPTLPTTADTITFSVERPGCTYTYESSVQGSVITLAMHASLIPCLPPVPPDPLQVATLSIGPLPAGAYTVVAVTDGVETDSRPLVVSPPTATLSLLRGRFTVNLVWFNENQGIPGNVGAARQLSDGSGYFWFYDAADVEVTVKMIDATAFNGYYWLFVTSGTTTQFKITVTDTWLSRQLAYESDGGVNANYLDLAAFTYN
jgi:hypothetical protein